MVISTKGRYALRLMIDLAQHCDEGFISLKTVSQRQDVSLKYMEAIAAALNRTNLVNSQRGKEGGHWGQFRIPPMSAVYYLHRRTNPQPLQRRCRRQSFPACSSGRTIMRLWRQNTPIRRSCS